MERIRKPYQGIFNIVRFNWHFYLLAAGCLLIMLILDNTLPVRYFIIGSIICVLIAATTLSSLLVSFYVYDVSGLYNLNWLNRLSIPVGSTMANINAGFDETSNLLKAKFPDSELLVFDFYDPLKHNEISIKRARRAYPAFPGTERISTSHLPLPNNYLDNILIIFAAHEIRKEDERDFFFKELKRTLKPSGQIVVTEHLRDIPNFLAYNVGFFHFINKGSWYRTFKNVGLTVFEEEKVTPFVTVFILKKDGTTH